MKIYHKLDEDSPHISKEDKEKISILKLVDIGKYIKDVGIKDGQFYVLSENETDEIYLEYKQAMHNIENTIHTYIDQRTLTQKQMEFFNKKAEVMRRLMEMPK